MSSVNLANFLISVPIFAQESERAGGGKEGYWNILGFFQFESQDGNSDNWYEIGGHSLQKTSPMRAVYGNAWTASSPEFAPSVGRTEVSWHTRA